MFATEGGQSDGSTNYDTIDYVQVCTKIIKDLNRENLAASRRITKRIRDILRIYCWKNK